MRSVSAPRYEKPPECDPSDLSMDAFRPRTFADYLVYVLPLAVGPPLWWWLVDATGESEPWDADLYWPVMLGVSFLLGIALGWSRIPRVESDLPLVGFLVAAVLVFSEIVSSFFTTHDPSKALFLPLLVVFWGPIFTAVFGAAATAGVVTTRSVIVLGPRRHALGERGRPLKNSAQFRERARLAGAGVDAGDRPRIDTPSTRALKVTGCFPRHARAGTRHSPTIKIKPARAGHFAPRTPARLSRRAAPPSPPNAAGFGRAASRSRPMRAGAGRDRCCCGRQ